MEQPSIDRLRKARARPPQMIRTSVRTTVSLLAAVATWGCLEVAYTPEGIPIVPYDADAAQVTAYDAGGTRLAFALETWTNRMPGPRLPRTTPGGFPVNVSLKITVEDPGHREDSVLVPALSLWSESGDSLLASLRLMRVDGSDPWVPVGPPALLTELTGDPSNLPLTGTAPDQACRPRLMIKDGGRIRFVSLPTVNVAAVY